MSDFGVCREVIPKAQNDECSAYHEQATFIEYVRRRHGGTVAELLSMDNHGHGTIAEREICDYIEQKGVPLW